MNQSKNHALAVEISAAVAVAFLFLAGNTFAAGCSAAGNASQAEQAKISAIQTAASPKLYDLLELAEQSKQDYGFEANDHLEDAVLGAPMPVYTMDQSNVSDYCDGQAIEPLLKPSGHWLVPVTINGSFRAFVEVARTATNTFIAQKVPLCIAKVWKIILKRWPPEKNFHPKLVVYGNVPGYFFTIPEVEPQNMTDIVRILAEVDTPATLSPATVILYSWRS